MLDSGFVYSEKLWSPPPPPPNTHTHTTTPTTTHAALSPCSHTRHQPLPLLWRSDLVEPECESTLLTPESLDTHNNSSYVWQYHTLCYQRRVSQHTSCFRRRSEAQELEITLPAVSEKTWIKWKQRLKSYLTYLGSVVARVLSLFNSSEGLYCVARATRHVSLY